MRDGEGSRNWDCCSGDGAILLVQFDSKARDGSVALTRGRAGGMSQISEVHGVTDVWMYLTPGSAPSFPPSGLRRDGAG